MWHDKRKDDKYFAPPGKETATAVQRQRPLLLRGFVPGGGESFELVKARL